MSCLPSRVTIDDGSLAVDIEANATRVLRINTEELADGAALLRYEGGAAERLTDWVRHRITLIASGVLPRNLAGLNLNGPLTLTVHETSAATRVWDVWLEPGQSWGFQQNAGRHDWQMSFVE